MNKLIKLISGLAFLSGAVSLNAQGMPEMPTPTDEHNWMQRFVGEWESTVSLYMAPDSPPMEIKAKESYRAIGGFWVVADIVSLTPEMPFSGVYTLGYDKEAGNYIGIWVESMTGILSKYEGSVDSTSQILTMETDGHCPMRPGEKVRFRDVTEFKSADHRMVTTSIRGDDGVWVVSARIDSKRK